MAAVPRRLPRTRHGAGSQRRTAGQQRNSRGSLLRPRCPIAARTDDAADAGGRTRHTAAIRRPGAAGGWWGHRQRDDRHLARRRCRVLLAVRPGTARVEPARCGTCRRARSIRHHHHCACAIPNSDRRRDRWRGVDRWLGAARWYGPQRRLRPRRRLGLRRRGRSAGRQGRSAGRRGRHLHDRARRRRGSRSPPSTRRAGSRPG